MSSNAPRTIHRLEESLINRIAAGEIIHRPASALKEILENSLDAGATSIRVTVKDGGLKLLQLQDNGSGIQKADLPILAERFTTSKLSTFSDLSKLTTYGFRGEALASISHVAHLAVITKTKKDSCAWKAHYLDGELVPAKPGTSKDPKPCAGNDGTTIIAENLFYNTPTRLAALRNSSEEYARILDVVTRYAVHNPHVAFLCKKASSPSPDLSTPSDSTTVQAIRLLYGQAIARELLTATASSSPEKETPVRDDDTEADTENGEKQDVDLGDGRWKAEAHFTSINYHAKKTLFLLFINHRLVESSRMKRALEAAYNNILPKGACPFMYLSIEIDPRAVDVNVHPTKREVHFLDEEVIIERIADVIQRTLVEKSRSRSFTNQTQSTISMMVDKSTKVQPQVSRDEDGGDEEMADPENEERSASTSKRAQVIQIPKKALPSNKVRTSASDRTLDSMFAIMPHASNLKDKGKAPQVLEPDDETPGMEMETSDQTPAVVATPPVKVREIQESECFLSSVLSLRKAVVKSKHNALTELLQKHIFVGIVDRHQSLSLIQHSTKLYLVNHAALAEELFYQLGLRQFGNMYKLKLQPPPPIKPLIRLAVKAEKSLKASGLDLSEDEIVDRITDKLIQRSSMLSDYFSVKINDKGELETLPLLQRDYRPDLNKLPLFLMRLGPQVDWSSEQTCFNSFLRELAYFYCPLPFNDSTESVDEGSEKDKESSPEVRQQKWQIQHVIFPYLRKYFVAPKSLLDQDVVQVADLPDLYKVFERC